MAAYPREISVSNEVEDQLPALFPYLLRTAKKYFTENHADAEDLVTETCILALRKWWQYHPGTNLRAWLFYIMRSRYITIWRKKRRENEFFAGFVDIPPRFERIMQDVSMKVEIREQLAALGRAMDKLPDHYRRIIELRHLHGLSYAEISTKMHIPIGTVVSRSSRALEKLKPIFYREYKDAAKSNT